MRAEELEELPLKLSEARSPGQGVQGGQGFAGSLPSKPWAGLGRAFQPRPRFSSTHKPSAGHH